MIDFASAIVSFPSGIVLEKAVRTGCDERRRCTCCLEVRRQRARGLVQVSCPVLKLIRNWLEAVKSGDSGCRCYGWASGSEGMLAERLRECLDPSTA